MDIIIGDYNCKLKLIGAASDLSGMTMFNLKYLNTSTMALGSKHEGLTDKCNLR